MKDLITFLSVKVSGMKPGNCWTKARRLIERGCVTVDGEVCRDKLMPIGRDNVVKLGDRVLAYWESTREMLDRAEKALQEKNEQQRAPIPGKQYRLTSDGSEPCIALGNSWEESRVR